MLLASQPLQRENQTTNLIILLAGIIAAQMTLSMYLPALPSIQSQWHLSVAKAQLTLSVFFVTLGVAQLVYGTLSDHFGRRPLIMVGLLIAVVGDIYSANAESFTGLLGGRILQGLGIGALLVLGRACLKDMFSGQQFSQAVAMVSVCSSMTFAFAPFLGGWLSSHFSWRYDFYFGTVFTLLVLLSAWPLLFETHKQKTYGVTSFQVNTIVRNYLALLRNSQFLSYVLLVLLGYLTLMLCIANAPFYFQHQFGISVRGTSCWMLVLPLSYLASIYAQRRFMRDCSKQRLLLTGAIVLVGAAVVFIGQVMLGIESPISLVLAFLLASGGGAFLFINGTAGMLSVAENVGAGAALSGVLQMVGTSLLVACIAWLHWNTIAGLGWIMLVIAALVGIISWPKGSQQAAKN